MVEDYESAIAAAEKIKPDLIIADIILGGYTGIDLLREIKRKGFLCPVIFITGQPNVETASEPLHLSAYDYLTKPVRKAGLLKIAHQALKYKNILDKKSYHRG